MTTNPRLKEYHHAWYLEHQDKVRACSRARYLRVRVLKVLPQNMQCPTCGLTFSPKHLLQIYCLPRCRAKAYTLRYPVRRRAQASGWQKRNKSKTNAITNLRRARLKGATIGQIDYEAILQRDKQTCGICRKRIKVGALSFDHILPLAHGGTHSNNNLRPTHILCNRQRNRYGQAQLRMV